MSLRLLPLTLALSAAFAGAAQAQSLTQLFEAAKAYDAGFKSAQAQYQANFAKAEQARALLRPTVNLSSGFTRTDFDNRMATSTVATSDRTYNTKTATLSASQPLYRPANEASLAQGFKQLEQSEAALRSADKT